jgi:heme-degrading monooxygenase HmoA
MIMRITWGKLRPGTWDAFERAALAGKESKGLQGRWLAQDSADPDGGFAVSVWDSSEDLQAYEQSAFFQQEVRPALQPFFVGEYYTHRCDVKYSR